MDTNRAQVRFSSRNSGIHANTAKEQESKRARSKRAKEKAKEKRRKTQPNQIADNSVSLREDTLWGKDESWGVKI